MLACVTVCVCGHIHAYFAHTYAHNLSGSDACPTGYRRLRVQPLPGQQHSFVEIDHEIVCYGHSLSSSDSRSAVVSF